MSEHTGFFHDPTSDINAIREMLAEKYHLGLPVIKELIQNADDAKAQKMVIGWAMAVPNTSNPLLHGPGVFVINDGSFFDEDARAIKFMGQSAKIEGATIGKFGLGLKSVFHHCEAFFYFSSEYREIQRGNRIYRTRDILNPWCGEEGSPFPEWDRFDPDDQEALIKLLKPLLPPSPSHWFCLWLPLRQARYFEQGFHPLFPRYEGDKNIPPETIFLSAFEKHISAMVPTLRYLNSIRSVLQNEQGVFFDYAKVNLENGAERMIYDGKPFDMRALYGQVSLSGQNVSSMVFGGRENFLKDPALGGLKGSKHWPRRSVTEDGRSISKSEKADPHCAAVFTGRPAEEGAGKLEISWGIFLPLSDDETREIVSGGGDWSYTLLLHGIFFVDAGRFRIEFSDPAGEGFQDPDRTVRRRWNQMLRDRGTLKLLLPGLQSFVDKNKLSNERVVHLTHMLAQSKKVFATYRSTICQDHAWVRCVGKTSTWTLVPANKPIYVLPEVPRDERRRPFEVFGHLETLCSQHVFTYDGLPRLDRGATWEWPIGILQQLLDCDAASAFKRQAYLDYLVQFVERLSESDQTKVTTELSTMAHCALSTVERTTLRKHGFLVQRFLACIEPARRLRLKGETFDAFDSVFSALLKLNLDLLLVPESLDAEDNPGIGKLSLADGRQMLEMLARYKSNIKDLDTLRMTLALQILDQVEGRDSLLTECGDLRLFRGYDMQQDKEVSLTLNEFQQLRDLKTLFRYGQNFEARLLPRALQQALSKGRVILVSDPIGSLLGGNQMPLCDEAACIQTLVATPALTEPQKRVSLVRALQNWSAGFRSEDFARGMRYLLHGSPDCLDSIYDLFAESSSQQRTVWDKLVNAALATRESSWQLVPRVLTEQIALALWEKPLQLRAIDRDSTVQLLNEVDASEVDTQTLTNEERIEAFGEIRQDELLCKLVLCEDLQGRVVSIEACDPTYVAGTFEIDPVLLHNVTVLKRFDDEDLAARQERLVPVLDSKAALEIIFLHNDPSLHHTSAFNALAAVADIDALSDDVGKAIRDTAWVPIKNGGFVPPGEVIFVAGVEDEITRVLAATGGVYHGIRSLDKAVVTHAGFSNLQAFFPNVRDSIEILMMAIGNDPDYHLGGFDNQPMDANTFMTTFQEVFAEAPREVMPAYELVWGLFQRRFAVTADLVLSPEGLFKPLTPERSILVLKFLSQQHQKVAPRQKVIYKRMFDDYLRVAAIQSDFFGYLPDIPLLNRQNVWCCPKSLCLKADGVDHSVLVDEAQGFILEFNVPQIGSGEVTLEAVEAKPGEIAVPKGQFESAFKDGVQRLAAYFKDWEEAIPGEVIGGLLCILGDQEDMVALAEDYLDRGNRTLDNTRDLFDWQVLPSGRIGAGEDIYIAMSKQRFLVQITDDQTVEVPNLLGDSIDVPLDRNFEHLFVGADLYFQTHLGAGIRVKQLNLKRVNVASHNPIELRRALCNSANIVLSRVYEQYQTDVTNVFEALSKSEQLDIRIAQDLILDQALPYLQQLGVHKEPKIRDMVREWHAARRAAAEERQRTDGQTQQSVAGEKAIQKVKQDFITLLREDEDVRKDILSALRIRMDNHYQYKPNSVPFEIFQNADDAVVELRGMGVKDGPRANRFGIFVDQNSNVLGFFHHGRLINQFRLGEFNGRDLGYDRDLEKMLVVSASDKGDQEVGETVTGKFGLGFKSVFLITDVPRVFSGPMVFDVIGGMLPLPIVDKPALGDGHDRRSTFFELRLCEETQSIQSIMERFERLSAVSLAFARAIRHIDLDIDGNTHTVSWAERPVHGVSGASVGMLIPFLHRKENRQGALILRKEEGAFLLGLGASGVEMLDSVVPALWVTTPMRQAAGYGFAINGPFEIDVGRAQLAHESQENNRLQDEMGTNLGQVLCSLFDASKDWHVFCCSLNLTEDLTPYDFWLSLWSVVGLQPVSHLAEQASSEACFIRELLWSEGRGVARLFSLRSACPTGLWGKHQVLTKLDRIQVEVRGCLDTEEVFLSVAEWPEIFRQMRPGEGISHRAMSQPLSRLMGPQSLRSIWLADVFEEKQQIDPKTAQHLGALIDEAFLRNLEESEQERLVALLGTFQFIGRDGRYHRGDNLLIANDATYDYRDEGMRAAFAPDDRVLSEDYVDVALSFFKACRRILNAKAVDMANWVLKAKDKQTREAVLDYLLNGELDSELARELRQKTSGTWLGLLPGDPLLEGYNEQEKRQILANLWLHVPDHDQGSRSDPGLVLPKIYDWWKETQDKHIAHYYEITYPGGIPPKLSKEGVRRNIACRRDWLVVFMLGIMQKLGRATPEAHRNFLLQRLRDGDLDVFADPNVGPDAWMNVLKNFLDKEGEVITYFHWMTQFTGFFQLAKWLHHYAESLLSADRLGRKFALNHLLAPRINPDFQGGGPDAPSIVRTLGIGAHFCVRELVRQSLITKAYVHPHCYMPVLRVRRLFKLVECHFNESERANWSEQIHAFLVAHLGEAKATFDQGFDIPFQVIARSTDLQEEFFGGEVMDVKEEDIDEDA